MCHGVKWIEDLKNYGNQACDSVGLVSNLLYSIANELASIFLEWQNSYSGDSTNSSSYCLILTGLTTKKFIVYTKVMVTIIKSQGLTPIISLYVRPHVADIY